MSRRSVRQVRVAFVGSHASGKSVLARWVSRRWDLPYLAEVARVELAKQADSNFDRLRLDVDLAGTFQRRVLAAQLDAEEAMSKRPDARCGFVSDRSFDNLAYFARHAEGVAIASSSTRLRRYVRQLRIDAEAGVAVVFFTRPHPCMAVGDGGRAEGDLDLAGVHAIDGMVQLLLELGDGVGAVPYVPVEGADPKMRRRLVEAVLTPLLGHGKVAVPQ